MHLCLCVYSACSWGWGVHVCVSGVCVWCVWSISMHLCLCVYSACSWGWGVHVCVSGVCVWCV